MISLPFEQLGEWAGAGFLALCGGFGASWFNWLVVNRNRHHSPTTTIKRDLEIRALLREIRVTCKADRAFVADIDPIETHKTKTQKEFEYSWTHEDTATRCSTAAARFQHIRTSLVPTEMSLVEEAGPSFKRTAEMPDCTFQHMCLEIGNVAVARCAIRDSQNVPVAFIGLDYCYSMDCPDKINELVSFAARMERMLSL